MIEGTDMTVGTPSAMTLLPRLAALNVLRLFPTPDPGLIPVSVICMVVFRRLLLDDAMHGYSEDIDGSPSYSFSFADTLPLFIGAKR